MAMFYDYSNAFKPKLKNRYFCWIANWNWTVFFFFIEPERHRKPLFFPFFLFSVQRYFWTKKDKIDAHQKSCFFPTVSGKSEYGIHFVYKNSVPTLQAKIQTPWVVWSQGNSNFSIFNCSEMFRHIFAGQRQEASSLS